MDLHVFLSDFICVILSRSFYVVANDVFILFMAEWWLSGEEFAYNAGDTGSIPGSGKIP